MSRSAAIVAGVILLPSALLLLGFLVQVECPDCGGAWVRYRSLAPTPGFENPGCPRCRDDGKTSWLGRWTRRSLAPELSRLFRTCWDPSDPEDPIPRVQALAVRSGSPLDVEDLAICEEFFVHTDEDPLVVAALHTEFGSRRHRWVLVLFDLDGAELDRLAISYPGRYRASAGIWTTTSQLELRSFLVSMPETKALRFGITGSAGRRELTADALRVHVRHRRFEAVAENKSP